MTYDISSVRIYTHLFTVRLTTCWYLKCLHKYQNQQYAHTFDLNQSEKAFQKLLKCLSSHVNSCFIVSTQRVETLHWQWCTLCCPDTSLVALPKWLYSCADLLSKVRGFKDYCQYTNCVPLCRCVQLCGPAEQNDGFRDNCQYTNVVSLSRWLYSCVDLLSKVKKHRPGMKDYYVQRVGTRFIGDIFVDQMALRGQVDAFESMFCVSVLLLSDIVMTALPQWHYFLTCSSSMHSDLKLLVGWFYSVAKTSVLQFSLTL